MEKKGDLIGEIGTAQPAPILVKKEFTTLQEKPHEIQIGGFKCACGSVWCRSCYTRKGGSKRFAERLSEMNHRAVRQVVLTVDKKKFDGSGQKAYETLRKDKAVAQFIHNLKRTANIKVVDWAWNLEWHEDGSPHYHLFIETQKGPKGRIGNENLLAHWPYGLVFESYVKSKKHWHRFTDYFAGRGYFNPKQANEYRKKQHQLELPEWAQKVTYRIRKTGSMVKRKGSTGKKISQEKSDYIEEKSNHKEGKTYREILDSCGMATYCQIQKIGWEKRIWKKINIPYNCFKQFPGKFKQQRGFVIDFNLDEFRLFKTLYDFEINPYTGYLMDSI